LGWVFLVPGESPATVETVLTPQSPPHTPVTIYEPPYASPSSSLVPFSSSPPAPLSHPLPLSYFLRFTSDHWTAEELQEIYLSGFYDDPDVEIFTTIGIQAYQALPDFLRHFYDDVPDSSGNFEWGVSLVPPNFSYFTFP